jgi:hypothetical protein
MNLTKLERYLRVNVLGPGPRLIKKNSPGRGLTKVEKHWLKRVKSDKEPTMGWRSCEG